MFIQGAVNQRHRAGAFLTVIAVGLCLVGDANFRQTTGVVLLGSAFVWAWGSGNRLLHGCIAAIGVILLALPLGESVAEHVWVKIDYRQRMEAWEKQLPELARQNPDLSAGLVAEADPYAVSGGGIAATDPRATAVPNPGRSAEDWLVQNASQQAHAPIANDGSRSRGRIDYNALAKQFGAIDGLPPGSTVTPMTPPLPPGYVLTGATRTLPIPGAGDIAFPETMSSPNIAKSLRAGHIHVPSWYLEGLDAGVDAAAINGLNNPGWTPVPDSLWESIKAGLPLEGSGALLLVFFATPFILATKNLKSSQSPSLPSPSLP